MKTKINNVGSNKKFTPEEWVIKKAATKEKWNQFYKERDRIEREVRLKEHEERFQNIINQEQLEYVTIPENPGYYCTSDGRVWSKTRGIFLKPANHRLGYLFIGRFTIDGKYKLCLIHQVVAHAFLPKIEGYTDINHKDGSKHNNAVSNLERCTRKQNLRHAWDSGLMENVREKTRRRAFNKARNSKLSEDDIRAIRAKCSPNIKDLAIEYGVRPIAIDNVISGKSWAWVA